MLRMVQCPLIIARASVSHEKVEVEVAGVVEVRDVEGGRPWV